MPQASTSMSFLYSLLGIVIVMAAIAVLAGLMMLIRRATAGSRANEQEETAQETAPAAAPMNAAAAAPVLANAPAATTGTMKLKFTDDRTAALLMAIISDQTNIPLNQLRFKSIVCLNP